MPALVKAYQRFVDLAVLLCQRYFVSGKVVGHLQMATRTFKFLKMFGDGFGRHEFMSEKRAQQLAPE